VTEAAAVLQARLFDFAFRRVRVAFWMRGRRFWQQRRRCVSGGHHPSCGFAIGGHIGSDA
jgi:hypothetical protein